MSAKRKTTAGRKRVEFTTEAPSGSDVFVAGSFNDWDATAKQLEDTSEQQKDNTGENPEEEK